MYIFMGVFFACLLLFIISGIRDSWTGLARTVHKSSERSFIFLISFVHLRTYASKIGHENKFEKRWEISLLKWKREHMIPVRVRRTRPVWTQLCTWTMESQVLHWDHVLASFAELWYEWTSDWPGKYVWIQNRILWSNRPRRTIFGHGGQIGSWTVTFNDRKKWIRYVRTAF